ncbi:hypothetical protein [Phenylobacterium sp.]|uniref:hypothetical protein n=1 Tax=Phenylobacterium sp. TaxID=1871053 RepID=UPI001205CF6F|nr:hypothetical protein [Phenylobacterium sp.]THD62050.1 MAG: hypothetical protein E8A49_08880 [Phenylobacterium sp.]
MRRRHRAAVIAVSVLAHLALVVAWMTTRAPPVFVEPPAMAVELLRPERPPRPKISPPPRKPQTATVLTEAPAQPPPAAQPPAAPAAPKVLDTQHMADTELLNRAGPRPDMGKVFADLAKRPLFSRNRPPAGDDCKPASEHSNRIAPPCPLWGGPITHAEAQAKLPLRGDIADQAQHKGVMKGYQQAYGHSGVATPEDFPGFRHRSPEELQAEARERGP